MSNEGLSLWFRFLKANCNIDRTFPCSDNQTFKERETKGLYLCLVIDECSLSHPHLHTHTHTQIYIAIHSVIGCSQYQLIVDVLMM